MGGREGGREGGNKGSREQGGWERWREGGRWAGKERGKREDWRVKEMERGREADGDRGKNTKKETEKLEKYEDEDWSKDWSEVATATKGQKRQGTNCSPELLEGVEPCQHVHFGLLTYKTESEPIGFLKPQLIATWYISPRGLMDMPFQSFHHVLGEGRWYLLVEAYITQHHHGASAVLSFVSSWVSPG